MTEPKQYYEKILVSTGEVPEEHGFYNTNTGWRNYNNLLWFQGSVIRPDFIIDVEYWFKPVPSPKQEALDFAGWVNENYIRFFTSEMVLYKSKTEHSFYTLSELYDKFKLEKGER